jgi:DNA-binding MurR/RpiR family transcriptional regulator
VEGKMSIKSLGKAITLELAQVFDKIDDSQVEAFIEAIINAKRIIWVISSSRRF